MITLRAVRIASGIAGTLIYALASEQIARAEDGAVAIVEDISGKVTAVEPLDLLRPGKTIALKADEGLIISYLNSCQRENIRGGKVTIGKAQSDVQGGDIVRRRIACDPAALALTPEQANQSATLVFRKPPIEDGVKFITETRQPLIIAPDLKEINVEDVRQAGVKWLVKIVKGIADLTADHEILKQGGLYLLTGGGRTLIFRVGKEATDAPLPLLKRVIRF